MNSSKNSNLFHIKNWYIWCNSILQHLACKNNLGKVTTFSDHPDAQQDSRHPPPRNLNLSLRLAGSCNPLESSHSSVLLLNHSQLPCHRCVSVKASSSASCASRTCTSCCFPSCKTPSPFPSSLVSSSLWLSTAAVKASSFQEAVPCDE